MTFFLKIINKIRQWYWRGKFGSCMNNVGIGNHVIFKHPNCLHFGMNVNIGNYSCFLPTISYAGIDYSPKIIIGDGCIIGIRNSFAAIDRIEIGKNVLFAGYVHITDHSHGYEDITQPIVKQPLISKGPIVIDDNCWLGFSCEILSGVHIGMNSVVAARAVVTHDVPPYSIVAGNPAKIVKQYNHITKQWESVKTT